MELNHHFIQFAKKLETQQFKALSSGIGIRTKSKKAAQEKKVDIAQTVRVHQRAKILRENDKNSASGIEMYKSNCPQQFAMQQITSSAKPASYQKVNRSQFKVAINWIWKYTFALSLDLIFISCCLSLISVVFFLFLDPQGMQKEKWFLWLYTRVFVQLPIYEGLLGFSGLVFLYGVLFRLLVGATLGEVIIGKRFDP